MNVLAYDEVAVGHRFAAAVTVTETHLVLGAGLIGDFNPLHVNETFCRQTPFKTRILHGTLTSAIMSAPVGNTFAGTAIAYLEHNCRFLAPVRVGDTLSTVWTVTGKLDKPKHDGGIVEMSAVCRNQDDAVVAEAAGKILVANR